MEDLLNLIVVFQGLNLAVIATTTLVLYARSGGERLRHVSAIAVSYLILSALVLWSIAVGRVPLTSPRLYLALLAFVAGDYGLVVMLRGQYRRWVRVEDDQ